MKNSFFALVFLTVLVAALTFAYKAASPFIPEDTRLPLEGLEKDGGVYASFDGGATWTHDSAFRGAGNNSFLRSDVFNMVFHPGDARILYAATSAGLFMRNESDGGRWQGLVLNEPVYAVTVDPQDKQTVFIATENAETGQGEIARSRGEIFAFREVFAVPSTNERVIDIVVDASNTSIIFALTSRGSLLRSDDGGDSWRVAHTFSVEPVRDLVTDPNNPRTLYVTSGDGILRSRDRGATWINRTAPLRQYAGGSNIRGMAIAENNSSLLYLATDYGILRSENSGDAFRGVEFLLPFNSQPISAVALFPQDADRLWVAVGPQIYQSADAGVSWQVRVLPTNRSVHIIAPHPFAQSATYLGVRADR